MAKFNPTSTFFDVRNALQWLKISFLMLSGVVIDFEASAIETYSVRHN